MQTLFSFSLAFPSLSLSYPLPPSRRLRTVITIGRDMVEVFPDMVVPVLNTHVDPAHTALGTGGGRPTHVEDEEEVEEDVVMVVEVAIELVSELVD